MSVVIPAYNAAAHLGECLDSVVTQASDTALETLVIDDGSSDNTAEIACVNPGVKVIRLAHNVGPSGARNAGIAAARGEFVAFLDADDRWPPGTLATRLATLRRHPDAALVFGDCLQFDAHGPRDRTLFEVGGFGANAWGSGGLVPDAYKRLLVDNFITTGSVVVRRAALLEAGGFADDLRLVEDLDLWLRIAHRHPLAWCPQVCLLRRRHGGNLSRDAEAMAKAFLTVLDRQVATDTQLSGEEARTIRVARARELLHLADLALTRGSPHDAMRWAAHSLAGRPSARALWRLAQALLLWTRLGGRTGGRR